MNHFPQTTAALRRLARAIADLFKSPSQRYAKLVQSREYIEYEKAFKSRLQREEERRFLDAWSSRLGCKPSGSIDRTSSPWWRVKDYEEAEEEGKPW